MSELSKQLGCFIAVGLINTGVGFSVIWLAMSGFGLNPFAANAAGYAVGICVSFLLNRRWTFTAQDRPARQAAGRFVLAFALAYGANLAVLSLALALVPGHPMVAQGLGMVTYTAFFFVICRTYVFAARD